MSGGYSFKLQLTLSMKAPRVWPVNAPSHGHFQPFASNASATSRTLAATDAFSADDGIPLRQ